MSKDVLFSLTKKDFIIQTFRGSGAGGQHRNKRNTGIRIIHPESGAKGEATEERSQKMNKEMAFKRLVESDKFKIWHKKKVAELLKDKEEKDNTWDYWMKPENFKVEVYNKDKKCYEEVFDDG